jgi:dTDP-4-amino-4,6-dideoxygalactose transaminase
MRVPLLDLHAQYKTIKPEIDAAVERVFASQQFILGDEVAAFEQALAEYCGSRHAIGCASGSDALLLALMALGVGAGDEVITVSYSFFATASSITRLGAMPVFVDISLSDFNLDPALLERAITPRTKAIIPVDLYGQCADMEAIAEIAERSGLPVVEDAAQAVGAEYKGRHAGTFGTIGCLSFFPSKNLGGAGDGGMLLTDDDSLASKLRVLRVHGGRQRYYHSVIGINSRLDALQAAVLGVKLRCLDRWNEARRAKAARYDELFAAGGLNEFLMTPTTHEHRRHIYHQYTLRCSRRDELLEHLRIAGIGCEVYYPVPLHRQECFAYLGYRQGSLPASEQLAADALSLPVYAELDDEMQDYVVEKVTEFYSSGRSH